MKRLAAAVAAGLALTALGACAQQQEGPADPAPAVEPEGRPEADVADCDAEDRRRNEMPDCGYQRNGKFVPWSWVRDGRTTPPPGWRPDREPQATPAPRVTARSTAKTRR